MTANIGALGAIHDQVKKLNRQNNQLRAKYQGAAKYTRIHQDFHASGTGPMVEIFSNRMGIRRFPPR